MKDISYIKRRFDFKLKKYNLNNFSNINRGKNDEILFSDISSNGDHIIFTYQNLIYSNIRLDFNQLSKIYIANDSIFKNSKGSLSETKLDINELKVILKNKETISLFFSKDGIIYLYKDLLDLAIFLYK